MFTQTLSQIIVEYVEMCVSFLCIPQCFTIFSGNSGLAQYYNKQFKDSLRTSMNTQTTRLVDTRGFNR